MANTSPPPFAERTALWCFNVDARKQDQLTGTTSSNAFKHVRLLLKNSIFPEHGEQRAGDEEELERMQKAEACAITSSSEFVLRFGSENEKHKHYRDVSFTDIKKVFGKMIREGKLTLQLGGQGGGGKTTSAGELLLCKGDARECGRLLKLITTMKQAPAADRAKFLSSIGKCSCCQSKRALKEKKEEEREVKAKERERAKEEEKKQKMMKQEEKKEEKVQEKKVELVQKLETLESYREEIRMKTEKYAEEREQMKASKKAVKALQEQIEDERRMYAKEKKDLATEKEAMETERMAMNVERSRLNAKIEENKELKMRVEREREVVEEKQREVEKLRAEKEELIENLEREVEELKQSRKDVSRSTPGGSGGGSAKKKHKSRVAGDEEETPPVADFEENKKFPKPERTSTDSFYGGNNNDENNEKTFKRKAPASAATPNKKPSPEKKSSQRKVVLEDDDSSSEDATPEKFESKNENVETEEDREAARVVAENEARVKKMREAELERQRMEKEREEAAKAKRVRARAPKGDAERHFLKKSKEEIQDEKLQDKEHQRRRQQLAAESKQKSIMYTKATAKKWEYEEHRKALESMKDANENSMRYGSIPWPPESNIFLFNVMDDANERKMKVNVALKFWHPDKFRQMFGDKVAEADKEKIWERVQSLSTKCIQYKTAANARGYY